MGFPNLAEWRIRSRRMECLSEPPRKGKKIVLDMEKTWVMNITPSRWSVVSIKIIVIFKIDLIKITH